MPRRTSDPCAGGGNPRSFACEARSSRLRLRDDGLSCATQGSGSRRVVSLACCLRSRTLPNANHRLSPNPRTPGSKHLQRPLFDFLVANNTSSTAMLQGARKSKSALQPCVQTLEMRSVTRSLVLGKDPHNPLVPDCEAPFDVGDRDFTVAVQIGDQGRQKSCRHAKLRVRSPGRRCSHSRRIRCHPRFFEPCRPRLAGLVVEPGIPDYMPFFKP